MFDAKFDKSFHEPANSQVKSEDVSVVQTQAVDYSHM